MFKDNYSELTSQLSNLKYKNNKWIWTDKEEEIFNRIKQEFLHCVLIKYPNFKLPSYLTATQVK